jgi:hypothetical protein
MTAPAYITREEWGAKPFPRAQLFVPEAEHAGQEGHHAVQPARWSPEKHAKAIEANHLGRGWNGPYYAHGIHMSGTIVELRGWRASQGQSQFRNGAYYMPVVFLADFRTDTLTEAAMASWRFIRTWLLLSMPHADLVGWHNQRAATYCPGPPAERFISSPAATQLWTDEETPMATTDRKLNDITASPSWAQPHLTRWRDEYRGENGKPLVDLNRPAETAYSAEAMLVIMSRVITMLRAEHEDITGTPGEDGTPGERGAPGQRGPKGDQGPGGAPADVDLDALATEVENVRDRRLHGL